MRNGPNFADSISRLPWTVSGISKGMPEYSLESLIFARMERSYLKCFKNIPMSFTVFQFLRNRHQVWTQQSLATSTKVSRTWQRKTTVPSSLLYISLLVMCFICLINFYCFATGGTYESWIEEKNIFSRVEIFGWVWKPVNVTLMMDWILVSFLLVILFPKVFWQVQIIVIRKIINIAKWRFAICSNQILFKEVATNMCRR